MLSWRFTTEPVLLAKRDDDADVSLNKNFRIFRLTHTSYATRDGTWRARVLILIPKTSRGVSQPSASPTRDIFPRRVRADRMYNSTTSYARRTTRAFRSFVARAVSRTRPPDGRPSLPTPYLRPHTRSYHRRPVRRRASSLTRYHCSRCTVPSLLSPTLGHHHPKHGTARVLETYSRALPSTIVLRNRFRVRTAAPATGGKLQSNVDR